MGEMREEVIIKTRITGVIRNWLKKECAFRNKGNVTFHALEFYHDYLFYKKGFLIRLIQNHYDEIKPLMRVIGRAKKESLENDKKVLKRTIT